MGRKMDKKGRRRQPCETLLDRQRAWITGNHVGSVLPEGVNFSDPTEPLEKVKFGFQYDRSAEQYGNPPIQLGTGIRLTLRDDS